jgi:hypothetical protein
MRADRPCGHVTLVQTTTGTAPCVLLYIAPCKEVQFRATGTHVVTELDLFPRLSSALPHKCHSNTSYTGRAMAQAVSRRPHTAEACVRSRVSPCEIYGGQSGTGTGFSPSTSVFPCQYHSTDAPLKWKSRKT